MIAFGFTFPAGRYHATPWGRNVNEADVAWPPEPVRILRSLIATWWRKADQARFPKTMLDTLVDVLASEPPVFQLPEAVHTHIRTFMPAPTKPPGTLIYDAFFMLDRRAQLVVAWPDVALSPEQRELAAHLLERIGYLGRAESWVEAGIADEWDGSFNAAARTERTVPAEHSVPTDVAVPVSPDAWAQIRSELIEQVKPSRGKRQPQSNTDGLPERLCDALAVDTSEWQTAGWASPPPLRRLVYDRPAVGPLPRLQRAKRHRRSQQPGSPEVARFVLAGRPPPRVEDTLRIAEITRVALMSRSDGERPPIELTGRNDEGPLRDDPAHAHAFYLPEDANSDGFIDHIIVYCRLGFSDSARRSLDGLMRLWIEHGRAEEDGERGRKEWRVALEDIAAPEAFPESRLLQPSSIWKSVTPYLKSRFDKVRPRTFDQAIQTYREQITMEWIRRYPNISPPQVAPLVDVHSRFMAPIGPGGSLRSTLAFARTRRGRGGQQADTAGGFFQLEFKSPISGPIALGWGAHFGLGLFGAGAADHI
jgi:CRISPR-associated protein Csb2